MWKPNDTDPRPIWKQIEDRLHLLVASGRLSAGNAVPSVRQSARQMGVNPATVAKAHQRLGAARILEVRRGEGTFVRELPASRVASMRLEILSAAAEAFVHRASMLGFDDDDAHQQLAEAWEGHCRRPSETEDE